MTRRERAACIYTTIILVSGSFPCLNTLEKTTPYRSLILPTFETAIISQVNCNIGWRKKGKDKGLVHPYWIYHRGENAKWPNKFNTLTYNYFSTNQRSINLYFIYKKNAIHFLKYSSVCSNWSSESLLCKIWSISLLANFLVISRVPQKRAGNLVTSKLKISCHGDSKCFHGYYSFKWRGYYPRASTLSFYFIWNWKQISQNVFLKTY